MPIEMRGDGFLLDPRLESDCLALGRFPLSLLLLMNDANYPWCILVPQRRGVREVFDLGEHDRAQLAQESVQLAQRMADIFAAHKMNIAALGNVVEQLHIHHIVRYRDDPAWPAPVWGKVPPRPYSATELDAVRTRLQAGLDPVCEFFR